MHRLIMFIIAAILVCGGLLAAESFMLNFSYERNPSRLVQRCNLISISSREEEVQFLARLRTLSTADLNPLIVVTGGFLDAIRGYSYTIARDGLASLKNRCDIFYRQHQESEAIQKLIQFYADRGKPVVVIGHSWGGDAAAHAACAAGIPVELLVTLDPVSYQGPPKRPAKIQHWLNVYINYSTASWLEQSNDVARIGNPWQTVSAADENILCAPDIHHKMAGEMFRRYILSRLQPSL